MEASFLTHFFIRNKIRHNEEIHSVKKTSQCLVYKCYSLKIKKMNCFNITELRIVVKGIDFIVDLKVAFKI